MIKGITTAAILALFTPGSLGILVYDILYYLQEGQREPSIYVDVSDCLLPLKQVIGRDITINFGSLKDACSPKNYISYNE